MTTSAFSTIGSSFPFFKKGQILRNTDLNDLVNYLDEQDRHNRVLFVGIGIIGGLTHSLVEKTDEAGVFTREIVISSGYGLSSDGYLFQLTQECVTDRYRRIQVKESDFECEENDAAVKGRSIEWPAIELANQNEIELGDTTYTDLADLEDDLSKYVLVLQWHRKEQDRKRCIDECDEKGADINFFIRKLLINKEFLCADQDQATTASTQVEFTYVETCLPRFGTGMVQIRKEDQNAVRGVSLKGIEKYTGFYENYKNNVFTDAVIDQIAKAYQQAFIDFQSVLFLDTRNSQNPFDNLAGRLKTLKGGFENPTEDPATSLVLTPGKYGIQYFYDYLKDLILAYQQFMDVVCGLEVSENQIPDTCAFPGHLILGSFGTAGIQEIDDFNLPGEEEDATPGNEECRSVFQGSTLNVSKQALLEEARFLYAKMEYLSDTVSAPVPADLQLFANQNEGNVHLEFTEVRPIRITPSKGKLVPLNKRSLPFYYSKILRDCWSYQNKKQGREKAVLGYHFWDEINLDACDNKPFCAPLFYDLEGYPFFRIEGHVGRKTTEVFTELINQRTRYNLPFSIQFLKLGNLAIPENPEGVFSGDTFLDVSSLEVLYDKFRCDVEDELDKIADTGAQTAVTEVRATLVHNLPDFNYQLFSEKLQALIPSITDQNIVAALENIDEALYAVDCNFDTKIQLSKYVNVFHRFSEIFPGMEHLAGVPAGGTFIIVYSDVDEVEAGIISRVVGDFCLPHACCDTFSAVPEPLVSLYPGIFCSEEDKDYEILIYPKGGILEIAVEDCDQPSVDPVFTPITPADDLCYYFNPSKQVTFEVGESDCKKISIRYNFYGQKAIAKATVYRKPEIVLSSVELLALLCKGNLQAKGQNVQVIYESDDTIQFFELIINGSSKLRSVDGLGVFNFDLNFTDGPEFEIFIRARSKYCWGDAVAFVPNPFSICPLNENGGTVPILMGGQPLPPLMLGEDDEPPVSPIVLIADPIGGQFRMVGPDNVLIEPPITPITTDVANPTCNDILNYELDFSKLRAGEYELFYGFPCCEESAPLQVVIQEPTKEILFIQLDKYTFCSDDVELYPIRISPEDGTLTVSSTELNLTDVAANSAAVPFISGDNANGFNLEPAKIGALNVLERKVSIQLTLTNADNDSVDAVLQVYIVPKFQEDLISSRSLRFEQTVLNATREIGGANRVLVLCKLIGQQRTYEVISGSHQVIKTFDWQVNDETQDIIHFDDLSAFTNFDHARFQHVFPLGADQEFIIKLATFPRAPGCLCESIEIINGVCPDDILSLEFNQSGDDILNARGDTVNQDADGNPIFTIETDEFEIIPNQKGGEFEIIPIDPVGNTIGSEVLTVTDDLDNICGQARFFVDCKPTDWEVGLYKVIYRIPGCPGLGEPELLFRLKESIQFDISTREFCSTDAGETSIEITPGDGTLTVSMAASSLIIPDNSPVTHPEVAKFLTDNGNGSFTFLPSGIPKSLVGEEVITLTYTTLDGDNIVETLTVKMVPDFDVLPGNIVVGPATPLPDEELVIITRSDGQGGFVTADVPRLFCQAIGRQFIFNLIAGAPNTVDWQVDGVSAGTGSPLQFTSNGFADFNVNLLTTPDVSPCTPNPPKTETSLCPNALTILFELNAANTNVINSSGQQVGGTINKPSLILGNTAGGGDAEFRIILSPSTPVGGTFVLTSNTVANPDANDLIYLIADVAGGTCGDNATYYIDLKKVSSWNLIDVPADFRLSYSLPGCSVASNTLEFTLSLPQAPAVVTPPPVITEEDDPADPDQPDGGGTRSASIRGRSRSVSSRGAAQEKKQAPKKATAKKTPSEKSKTASKKATPTKAKATPAKKKATPAKSKAAPKTRTKPTAPTKKATPVKPKTTSAKKKAAPKPKSPAEDLFVLLNRRSTAQKAAMTQLAEDKRLAATASFGHANSFLLFPGGNLEIVNQRFSHDADLLIKNIKRAKGDREEQYQQVLTILLSNYLDKVVALDTENIPESARNLIKELLEGIKASNVDLTAFRRNWNGAGQRNKLKAKSADKFARLLR